LKLLNQNPEFRTQKTEENQNLEVSITQRTQSPQRRPKVSRILRESFFPPLGLWTLDTGLPLMASVRKYRIYAGKLKGSLTQRHPSTNRDREPVERQRRSKPEIRNQKPETEN
jgi:hypothetical protein